MQRLYRRGTGDHDSSTHAISRTLHLLFVGNSCLGRSRCSLHPTHFLPFCALLARQGGYRHIHSSVGDVPGARRRPSCSRSRIRHYRPLATSGAGPIASVEHQPPQRQRFKLPEGDTTVRCCFFTVPRLIFPTLTHPACLQSTIMCSLFKMLQAESKLNTYLSNLQYPGCLDEEYAVGLIEIS